MCNEVITLITPTETAEDEYGYTVESGEKEVEIFAHVKSVARAEYYAALAADIDARIIFEIDKDDFELSAVEKTDENGNVKKIRASKVRYDNVTYRIVRSYRTDKGMLELTCSEAN